MISLFHLIQLVLLKNCLFAHALLCKTPKCVCMWFSALKFGAALNTTLTRRCVIYNGWARLQEYERKYLTLTSLCYLVVFPIFIDDSYFVITCITVLTDPITSKLEGGGISQMSVVKLKVSSCFNHFPVLYSSREAQCEI